MKENFANAYGYARKVWKRGAAEVQAAAPHLEKAVAWGKRQQERLAPHIPTPSQIEIWAKENAARFGWNEKPKASSLEHLEECLNAVVAAIRQDSEKRTRIFVNTVIGKTTGIAAVTGIATLITAFGTAGTGAAIGTLTGAAATTAQFYWVGSIIGLGTAAGGVILAGTGIGIGVGGGLVGKRLLFGKPRPEDDLQDHEKTILVACITMINAIRQKIESGAPTTSAEMRLVAEQALIPLASQINQYWSQASLDEEGISGCQPFTKTLAFLHQRKLDHCRTEIGRIAISALAAPH
ncbi:hypothetical protein MCELHM10_03864 [Paracoccaceae bacterium]